MLRAVTHVSTGSCSLLHIYWCFGKPYFIPSSV